MRGSSPRFLAWLVLGVLGSARIDASRPSPEKTVLRVQVATSLGAAFDGLARIFEAAHPNVEVKTETGASLLLARRVLDLGSRPDVIAVADPEVFDELLLPEHVITGYVSFCGNRLGLLYGPHSKHAKDLTVENWHVVLRRPRIRVGRADPDAAPAGYRTLMLFDLAESHYGVPGLASELRHAAPEESIRSSLAQLAALVEAGELDYVFDYESSAKSRKLGFFALPAEIDFSDPSKATHYARVTADVAGRSPGERMAARGAPIRYAAAIPSAAAEPRLALEFLRLVLGPRGREVLKEMGFLVYPRGIPSGRAPAVEP